MTRSLFKTLLALAALVALLGLGACGGDDDEPAGGGDGGTPAQSEEGGANVTEELFAGSATENRANPDEGKKGGKLTVLSGGDVDYMDPGKTYYSYAWGIMDAIHRKLYSNLPNDPTKPVPDLADGDPEISEDGKTVTVKIKPGVMFSKPVNREVTSKDFKYAIERGLHRRRGQRLRTRLHGRHRRRSEGAGRLQGDPGHRDAGRPDARHQAHQGHGRGGRRGAGIDRSRSRCRRSTRRSTTRRHPRPTARSTLSTPGPYMVESDAEGKAIGYVPGKRIHLVRNPDYTPVDDFRPAFLDEIEFQGGNDDAAVATRRVLSGESLALGELEPPASQLQRLLESNKTELSAVPGGGWRMISLDTSRPPFDDLDVRKATIAGFNRVAARQQRGGEALGPIAQHLIPPGMAGFEESNGLDGWVDEMDWLASRRAIAPSRPSTSRRPASPRASTRAPRSC